MTAAPVSAAPSQEPANDASAPPDAGLRPRLLIVDDIADNRAVLARRFERRGYEITEAGGGYRALELIERHPFDLVLLDVMMPDLSGLEVLKRIRETHSQVTCPVIMVTAKNQSEDIVQAIELGANDYLTKPVDFAVALARANAQIGRKRAEEAVLEVSEALREANEDLERRVEERTAKLRSANEQLQREIGYRQQSEANLQYLAHHDPLTGLGNRVLLRKQLEDGLARVRRSGEALAVLLLDLDGFKAINDTLGHSVGDALLACIADRMRATLRDSDRAARLGGDEFAVLQLSEEPLKTAAAFANRLIEVVGKPCFIEGHQLVVGASVGIAVALNGGADPEQLLKSADMAMYRAKADGRGVYRFFEPEMNARAQARRFLEIELRRALAQGGLELYFQPLVNLQTHTVSAFEALLRWPHPERGFISPVEFIPLAEEIGLIVPIGEWALRQACHEAAEWPEDIKVAVNLSPVQFRGDRLVPAVVRALAESGLAPNRLDLEITESVLLEKTEANLATLHQLRGLGVGISMDDFGTGYSSLSYLRHFHFDKIKIDQSFIRDLARENGTGPILRAIATLGSGFGITTTAEGVETAEQLNWLRSEGCTEVQGYLISPPRPADEIEAILAEVGAEAEPVLRGSAGGQR